MFDYARSDTHFLLYVYDNMRNELIDKSNIPETEGNLIDYVLEESRKEALQRYERSFYDTERGTGPTGWYNMLLRNPALFTKDQFAVFRAVHRWRDDLARKEDESLAVIMQRTTLFNIAREMPVDMPSLLGCSHPISPPVRVHIGELLDVVKKAKSGGSSGPDMIEFMNSHPANLERLAKKAYQPKGRQSARDSIVQVIQSMRAASDNISLRTGVSRFWGSTMDSNKRRRLSDTLSGRPQLTMRLALPLPQLTAEVFSGASASNGVEQTTESKPQPEHQYTKKRKVAANDVFVIKELGGPRKRKAEEPQDDPGQTAGGIEESRIKLPAADDDAMMEIAGPSLEQMLLIEKAERKVARKAQKRLDKAQRKQEERNLMADGEDGGEDGDRPFDYAKAPSVLHAKPDKHARPGKQAFDPYSKSLDAPKGMRKSKKEIEGKSFTFKD